MTITHNIYHAAYAKVKGIELGTVYKSENGSAAMELNTTQDEFDRLINEYENGATIEINRFVTELSFVTFLVKRKCK